MAAREVGVSFDDFRAGDPASLRLRAPEVAPADQRVIFAPLGPTLDTWALHAPERPPGRIFPRRDARTSLLHLIRERVQNADHEHTIGATVEAAVHRGCHLMPAIQDTGMGKDDNPSGCERRREIPLATALQPFERPALAQLGVLGAVQLVDPLLELLTVEVAGHAAAA